MSIPIRHLAAALLFSSLAVAQNYTAPSTPVIGSPNTVTADPVVPKPSGPSCTVQLFTNLEFADFNPKYFNYTPTCPGPWKKVVMEGDFNVTAGRQFDRTAEIWIGGVNIYFGTTAEPSATVPRNWHVESNLTDYSALFAAAQNGRVDLGNLVDMTYTGIIYGSAKLVFYPADTPPVVADQVLPALRLAHRRHRLAQHPHGHPRRDLLPASQHRARLPRRLRPEPKRRRVLVHLRSQRRRL